MRTVEFRTASTSLITLSVRLSDTSENTPVRNYEGVQPPGLNVQGFFGDGLFQAGVLERDMGPCDLGSYATAEHFKAAIRMALDAAVVIRVDGWELPIAKAIGVRNWRLMRGTDGELVPVGRVALIPKSPHWRFLTGTKSGTGSQAGTTTVSGSGFASTDIGRLLVWASGQEALIVGFNSSSNVATDVIQTVNSGSFTVYDATEGIL